jgi:aminoglycoside 2''-phosphotransferase
MAPDYLSRIHQIKPDLVVRTVSLHEEGLANDAVIVNGEWVFRFAKGEYGLTSLARDRQVLQVVHPHLTLPIPTPIYAGEDFLAYRFLPGVALTRKVKRQLDGLAEQRVANQLATFLRQLHGVPTDDSLPSTAAPASRDFWLQRQREVAERIYPLLLPHQREWADDLFDAVLADGDALRYEPRLIHGDLAPYHILFDPSAPGVSGVIDFGVAGLGDPATDVGILLQTYGALFVAQMQAAYPELEHLMRRARFYAQAIELEWLLLGLTSGQPFWFTAHLGNARDL